MNIYYIYIYVYVYRHNLIRDLQSMGTKIMAKRIGWKFKITFFQSVNTPSLTTTRLHQLQQL